MSAVGTDASGSGSKGKRQLGDGSSGSKKHSKDEISNMWWEKCDEHEFRQQFRIHRSTFDFICQEVSLAHAEKLPKTTHLRTWVAVCLWKLATGEINKVVSGKFDLSIATICAYFREVCKAIVDCLSKKFLKWPDVEDLFKIQAEFESVYKMPVVGALHTSHIPINNPDVGNSFNQYRNVQRSLHNYNTPFYSIMLQGVIKNDGVFTDIDVSEPSKLSDYDVYTKSDLRTRLQSGAFWVVGSTSLPLMPGVLTFYPGDALHLSPEENMYNQKIALIQEDIAKRTYRRLKGRWAILQKPLGFVELEDAKNIVKTCCVLHNMCKSEEDKVDGQWLRDDVFTDTLPEAKVLSYHEELYPHVRDSFRDHIAGNVN